MKTPSVSQQIDAIIANHGGWKADILSQVRSIIISADPNIVEEVKWKTASRPEGLPVWSYEGILCIAETWKDNVKLVFFKGARLQDKTVLFNARLNSGTDRAIEFRDGDTVDETALQALVTEAIKLNREEL